MSALGKWLVNGCEIYVRKHNIKTRTRIQLYRQQVHIHPTKLLVQTPQQEFLCVHENGGHTSRHQEHPLLQYIFNRTEK